MKDLILIIGLISISTERLTEILKNVWDAGKHLGEWQYKLYVQCLATTIGSLLTYYVQVQVPKAFPEMLSSPLGCFIVGLVVCGSAGVLNSGTTTLEAISNELEVLKTAIKTKKS